MPLSVVRFPLHPQRGGLLLATLAITAAALTACGDDGSGTDETIPGSSEGSSSSAPATPTPAASSTAPATPSEAPPETAGGGETVAAPIYFAGQTPQGLRLFREFAPVPADGAVDAALALAAAGQPSDPDYLSLLPAGAPTATTGDGLIQVTLPDASWATRPDDMTAREAKLAVQQLVYTAQGTLAERIPVAFVVDGSVSPVLGINAPDGIRAARQLNVLALVNLTTPEQGASVSGSFTASGLASSFEATVRWQLRDPDGAVVREGFATADGFMDRLYPFTTEVDLTGVGPGDYTFAALTDDPSDGEGPGPTEDTKAITVE